MMMDDIKIYEKYECFFSSCQACFNKSHLINQCSKIHYIPDKKFMISKLNYQKTQERSENPRFRKKKFNALSNIKLIKSISERFALKSYEDIQSDISESELEVSSLAIPNDQNNFTFNHQNEAEEEETNDYQVILKYFKISKKFYKKLNSPKNLSQKKNRETQTIIFGFKSFQKF